MRGWTPKNPARSIRATELAVVCQRLSKSVTK
jgi:hypothetical protein